MTYRFSGHQTFVFRHGWLEKGVRLIQQNPHGFLDDDVLIKLGVGKNMVESIKYWCFQMQLLTDSAQAGELRLTPLAEKVFGDGRNQRGVDPFLEDDATLWLLHWSLMRNPTLSTWQLVFTRLNRPEFKKSELLYHIKQWVSGAAKVSDSSLLRDIECFVRNYAIQKKAKDKEENFDSPFLNLGLIQQTDEADLYRFNIGVKKSLPAELVGYSIIKMIEKRNTGLRVQNCLYDEDSPGQIFKLNEGALMDNVEELESKTRGAFHVDDTAGMVSIVYKGKSLLPVFADSLLDHYYSGTAVAK